MLSFNQLQEKKTKIKINPKKEDVMEGSCGSYSKGGEVKKNHGEDCDCQKCEKKRRKEDLGDEKTVSTEELAYDSQEKVSEEGNQEIAETEIKNLLTFDELQYAKTLNEEQLQEFLKGLLGGGSKPTSSSSGQMPNHSGLASRLGQRRQMLNKAMGKTDTKVLGFSKGGKVKKEEVEPLDEISGIMKAMKSAGVSGGTYLFALPGSPSACRDAWDDLLVHQLDYRHKPCNFVEIMPRLLEAGISGR